MERSVYPHSLSFPFSVLFGCTAPHNGSQGEWEQLLCQCSPTHCRGRKADWWGCSSPCPSPSLWPPALPPAASSSASSTASYTPSPSPFTAAGAAAGACSAARKFIAAVAARNASVTRRVRSAHCAEEQGWGNIAKQINKLLIENLLNVANGPVQQTLGANIDKLGGGRRETSAEKQTCPKNYENGLRCPSPSW